MCRLWSEPYQLQSFINSAIVKSRDEGLGTGWVRVNEISPPEVENNLRREISELQELLKQYQEKERQESKIENIAPLQQKFNLNYTYYIKTNYDDKKIVKTLEITWEQIFKIVGPSLYSPKSASVIEDCLKKYMTNEVHKTHLKYLDILDSDLSSVKIQLAAYKFIQIYDAVTVSGAVMEFIKLTDHGKRVLMELKTEKIQLVTSE